MYWRAGDSEQWSTSEIFSLNPSVMPAQFEIQNLSGIYELDGDSLMICLGPAGARPDTFESTEETWLIVFRRVEEDE